MPRAIAKIKFNRAKALLVLTEKVWEDDRMVRHQDDLERMTLNSYEFSAGQSIYQNASSQTLGNTPGRTTLCMWLVHSCMNWQLMSESSCE